MLAAQDGLDGKLMIGAGKTKIRECGQGKKLVDGFRDGDLALIFGLM